MSPAAWLPLVPRRTRRARRVRAVLASALVLSCAVTAAAAPAAAQGAASAASSDLMTSPEVVAGTDAGAVDEGAVDVLPVTQAGLTGEARHPLRLKVLGRTDDAQPLLTSTSAEGYTPAQVRDYLGLTGTGAGQTIAIVTAYDAPNIAKDLEVFNRTFGLPAPPSFKKVNQNGGTKYPRAEGGWALEAALDVQWAHAVAPAASILLVEATSSALSNLMTAVSYAAKQSGVAVISGSWGQAEFSSQKDQDPHCRLTKAVCVFASGDDGNQGTYPASSPVALGVGGTTLQLGTAGAVTSESAWSGSGGGVSLYSAKPAYQDGVTSAVRRAFPDVSYDGDPATGFSVYSSTPYEKQTGWFVMGGTSAGAPQWAGILAATAQLRKAAGKALLSAVDAAGGTPLHTALYSSAVRTSPSLADIVSGTNGTCGAVCTASAGFDTVTGVGSPRRGLDVRLRDQP